MAIYIPIVTELKSQGIDKAKKEFKSLEGVGKKAQFAIKKAAVPAAAALAGVAAMTKSVVAAGEAVNSANARILQINESMGLFGNQTDKVTDRIVKNAEALGRQYGIDNLVIKQTQAKLLTFKNLAKSADVVGGAFDRANQAALDMAAAGFGSAESNAVQLGKALENPIKGIAALAKSGVTFTEQEKDKIATLVESNKILEAQDMVLKAIETQVGGTAAATADDSAKMKEAFAQAQQQIGLGLMPVLAAVTPYLTSFADWMRNNPGPIKVIAAAVAVLAASILAVNAAMALNPAVLITAAIVALGIAVVQAYKKFEGFRNVVKSVVNGVLTYFEFIANAWIKTANLIIRGMNLIKPGKDIPSIPSVSFGRMGDSGDTGRGSSVPMMADGGIVTRPTLAVIGEGAGPEAVIPLDRLGSMMGGGGVTINVNGGDPNAVVDALRKYFRQNGPLPVGVAY